MCDVALIQEIEEGTGGDSKTLRRAIGQIMRTVNAIRDNMQKLPTVEQVNKIVETGLSIHIKSCDAARDDKTAPVEEFVLGKTGLKMTGRTALWVGLILGLIIAVMLALAYPHVAEWASIWKGQ